ncbi:MAG: hypothetical protein KGI71_06675 [Patescibacteria group bacterium]|nr:hypothetical protein [Patescibacteria group bacterium]
MKTETKPKRVTKAMQAAQAREAARRHLLTLLRPGDIVHTVLRHVSRSGMYRSITLTTHGVNLDYHAGIVLDLCVDRHGGLPVSGCGMDMGHHLVYSLSRALFPTGHGCIGRAVDAKGELAPRRWCPSNDHSNDDRDYTRHTRKTPHWHQDGGYALRHAWL